MHAFAANCVVLVKEQPDMQSSRSCPTCHHTVEASLLYCPNCHNAVDPALLDDLHWMYRTLQNLDRRIAEGQGSETITTLREDISREYLARRVDSGASVATTDTDRTAAVAPVNRTAPTLAQPFSLSAFFADQSIAILAYTGAFLLLVATLSFEVGGWQVLNGTAKLIIVAVVYAVFGIAGFVLLSHDRLRTISQAYLGIFALMTPLVGLAAYQFAVRPTGFSAAGMVSVTAWYTTLVYLGLALRTRYQQFSYMGWVAGLLAAQSILYWTHLGADWTAFTLAITAILLLAPHAFHIPSYFARPAFLVSMVASIFLAALMENEGATIAFRSLLPDTGVQSLQHPFTLATVPVTALALCWSLIVRNNRPSSTERQLLDLATLVLALQAALAIGGVLNLTHAEMGYLLAVLALVVTIAALVYRRLLPDYAITRRGAWGLAATLPVAGWLLNVDLPDPNKPLIVSLGVAVVVSLALATGEGAVWWLVYGGLALGVVFHSVVSGISSLQVGTTNYELLSAWSLAGFAVALWSLAYLLTLNPATQRFGRPVYVVAMASGVYAGLLIVSSPPFEHYLIYETAALVAFTGLALVTGLRRQEDRLPSEIAVGVFGVLALWPLIGTTGVTASYWEWILPPLVAALVALGVRAVLGRGFAIPLYVVALVGLVLGQIRLFTDESIPSVGLLGISPAAWFVLGFGFLATVAAVMEDQWRITALTAYCCLIAVIATTMQVPGYGLTLAVILVSISLRAWRGRWWNICLLSASVIMAMIEVSRFGDGDPHVYALKLGFLLVIALAGYVSVVLDRGYPETVIAASLLIFLPMFTQSVTSSTPVIFTSLLALEAIVMTLLGVGMRARNQMFLGSGFVALAALRGAVLAYTSGIPVAVIIAGLALFLLGVATWLSVQSRALASRTTDVSHPGTSQA
jgi:hypothetical protein